MYARVGKQFHTVDSGAEKLLVPTPSEIAEATSIYDCQVALGTKGGGYVKISFSVSGRKVAVFRGGFIGAFGGYLGWGKARFDMPVEQLVGQSGAYAVEAIGMLGGAGKVQLTGNGFTGSCTTGGIGAGWGAGTGGGGFTLP